MTTPHRETTASNTWLMLGLFLGGSFLAAAIGTWANFPNSREWYPLLNKPSWNPPSWIFGPVWTTLYVLMGVAVWRAWRTGPAARPLVRLYFVQLVFNALWSVLFFALKRPAWALADILGLLALLLWLQRGLWRTDRLAGVLWLPYVLWVGFATVLNATILRLN
jgi:benzodiazapine receptor